MAKLGSRRGAANLGFPLMVLTFILLGGFMYWLNITAEPTQPAMVDETAAVEDDFTGTVVAADDLKTGSEAYEGQVVRLSGVAVSQTMGSQAFFVDLPATANLPATPFLVRALPAAGGIPAMGTQVVITGMLLAVTDSMVSDWVGSGVINENDRLLVEFATHYIEAEQLDTNEDSGEGSGAGA